MRPDQIGDVNVIANAGTIRRRVISAIDLELGAKPEHRLDGDLDQVGCLLTRLSGTALGIGAGNIEVPQDHVTKLMRRARVAA